MSGYDCRKNYLDCDNNDGRVRCCYKEKKCCLPVNKDCHLVAPGPKPMRICPPMNCRKPCLIGCGDFYYFQMPKMRYHPKRQTYWEGDRSNSKMENHQGDWSFFDRQHQGFGRKVCGRFRFDESWSPSYNPNQNGSNQGYLDVGSSGPSNACGMVWTCCGTGTWETDANCYNSLAWKYAFQHELRNGNDEFGGEGEGRNNMNPFRALLQTIMNRKFFYRFSFCPAVRKDQPLTATLEVVHFPATEEAAYSTYSDNYNDNSDGGNGRRHVRVPVNPGLVGVISLTRQVVQSCDGATVLCGTFQGWNIAEEYYDDPEEGYDGDSFKPDFDRDKKPWVRRLAKYDQLPYVGHVSVKLANPLEKEAWCH